MFIKEPIFCALKLIIITCYTVMYGGESVKLKIFTFAFFMFLLCALSVSANGLFDLPVDITLNGDYIKMDDAPFLYDGTTYAPIREISDMFGAENVSWEEESETAIIEFKEKTIEMPINEKFAYIDGEKVPLSAYIMLVNSRTYVPVRFLSEHLGADVSWDAPYYTVVIEKNDCNIPEEKILKRKYDNDHIYWLAKIISCESQGESLDGMIAVGNVVLNRVESPHFPNTIYGVIFDDAGGVQFEPVINGTIHNEPTQRSYLAAKMALEGVNTAGDSLFFLNPDKAKNFWITQNREFYTAIGNHHFYL